MKNFSRREMMHWILVRLVFVAIMTAIFYMLSPDRTLGLAVLNMVPSVLGAAWVAFFPEHWRWLDSRPKVDYGKYDSLGEMFAERFVDPTFWLDVLKFVAKIALVLVGLGLLVVWFRGMHFQTATQIAGDFGLLFMVAVAAHGHFDDDDDDGGHHSRVRSAIWESIKHWSAHGE